MAALEKKMGIVGLQISHSGKADQSICKSSLKLPSEVQLNKIGYWKTQSNVGSRYQQVISGFRKLAKNRPKQLGYRNFRSILLMVFLNFFYSASFYSSVQPFGLDQWGR